MGCSLRDFTAEGPWVSETIHGHSVQMVRARYKSGSIKDLGTSYKVDGKFGGHFPFGDFATVRDSLKDDLNPTKVAAEEKRRAEVSAEMEIGNRLHWMGKEVIAALEEIIAINDEDQGTFNKRGGTRRGLSIVTAAAILKKIRG